MRPLPGENSFYSYKNYLLKMSLYWKPAARNHYWTPAAKNLYWTPAAKNLYWTPAAKNLYWTPAAENLSFKALQDFPRKFLKPTIK